MIICHLIVRVCYIAITCFNSCKLTLCIFNFLEEPTTFSSIPKTTPLSTPKVRTRPSRPINPTTIRAIQEKTKKTPVTTERTTSTTSQISQIIIAGHPQDNEIAGSNVNVQQRETPNVNVPLSIDGDRRDTFGARLNLGAIIALGAFGGFIFLAAIITTIVILIRRYVFYVFYYSINSISIFLFISFHYINLLCGSSAGESARSSHRLPSANAMPSRWYTLLALPFPDQQIGRREFSRNYRPHRAGYFSNPN